jgi:hypothetical protein
VEVIVKSTLSALLIVALATPAFAEGPSTSLREAAHHAALDESLTHSAPFRQRSWPEEHPIVLGALVGAGIGGVYGGLTCISPIAEGNGNCDAYTDTTGIRSAGALWGAAWGAGIGALTGLVVKLALR